MLARVNPTISEAMSASRIRLSDAVRFSDDVDKFSIVCSSRFWTAPRFARLAEMSEIASSSDCISAWALLDDEVVANVATAEARFEKPPPAPKLLPLLFAPDSELSIATETVWFAFAPIGKAAEAEPELVKIVSFAVEARSVTILAAVPL